MTLAHPSPDWMDRAACLDYPPELFFPDTSSDADEAVSVCSTCPVRAQCLADALDHDERWGVWGGLTERQRARLRPKDPICPRCRERRAEGVWRHCPQCRSEIQAEKHRRYTRRAS